MKRYGSHIILREVNSEDEKTPINIEYPTYNKMMWRGKYWTELNEEEKAECINWVKEQIK